MDLSDATLFRQQCYIDGAWCDADSSDTIDVRNPATSGVLGTIPRMGTAETRRAIEAAAAALPAWKAKTAKERASVLRRWFELMLENQEDLAQLMTLEQGKPLAEARGEIAYAASFIEWFAEEGKRIYGETIPQHLADRRILVLREPVGVVGAITPWNFPSAMITRKAGPALAAGCTIVCKPATETPYSAFALAELGERAGLPNGVLNILTGKSAEIGSELTGNPVVRKITFTGSTEIGKMLMEQAASTVKKVTMELGGNAPFLVFDDADIDAAVEGAMIAKMRNGGEACTAANRFYAHRAIYDEFTGKFAAAMEAVKVGPGLEPGVELGPMVNAWAIKDIHRLVDDATSRGSEVVTGGAPLDRVGYYYPPTVLSQVPQAADILREEVFGPVAPVVPFSDDDEVIDAANDTEYGLVSYLYTGSLKRGMAVSERLEAGMIGLNRGLVSDPAAPFGGSKQSGLGREGSHEGMMEYMETKYIAVEW